MNILITGSNGFIGKNLVKYLAKNTNYKIFEFKRNDDLSYVEKIIKTVDIVFHFAGINKSKKESDFLNVNADLTKKICNIVSKNPNTTLIYASSIQINLNNYYGKSKKEGENFCLELQNKFNNKVIILRLPGVFGNGCKPNYNSVVATFCHNTANEIDIQIIDPDKEIELLFLEDLFEQLIDLINSKTSIKFVKLQKIHKISVKRLAATIKNFHQNFNNIDFIKSKSIFERNLYKTYISYRKKE